jgi:hypothetical protein
LAFVGFPWHLAAETLAFRRFDLGFPWLRPWLFGGTHSADGDRRARAIANRFRPRTIIEIHLSKELGPRGKGPPARYSHEARTLEHL